MPRERAFVPCPRIQIVTEVVSMKTSCNLSSQKLKRWNKLLIDAQRHHWMNFPHRITFRLASSV
jgi:hypothetical protein